MSDRVVGVNKVMCLAALVNRKVMLHWFEVGVKLNQHIYMDILQNALCPKILGQVTWQKLW